MTDKITKALQKLMEQEPDKWVSVRIEYDGSWSIDRDNPLKSEIEVEQIETGNSVESLLEYCEDVVCS